jgi:phenylpyruvate tautomerase PptA (4-oxalocrotonate tautomerase family)
VNEAVLRAAGLTESDGLRVWTLIRDVPDGNWGAAGQQVRYKQLVEIAAGERDKEGAPA